MVKKKRAVFFDRDGVLIEAPVIDGYPKSTQKLQDIKICNGVRELCDELRKDFSLFIVTNQPDVSRNINSKKNVDDINFFLKKELLLDDIFICYCSEDKCENRKPNPGMLFNAKKKYLINLEESYMIGDRWRDIDAANNANCASILIERGYKETLNSKPTYTIQKINEARKLIK